MYGRKQTPTWRGRNGWISTSIPVWLHDRLREEANFSGKSMSAIVAEGVEKELDRLRAERVTN
jgi:hypothetical protein